MDEVHGDEAAFLQRLRFTALYSAGFMIVSGTEYGFVRSLSVSATSPSDWEMTGHDFRLQIRRILEIKRSLAPLREEAMVELAEVGVPGVVCLVKTWEDERVLVVMNLDTRRLVRLPFHALSRPLGGSDIINWSPARPEPCVARDDPIHIYPNSINIYSIQRPEVGSR